MKLTANDKEQLQELLKFAYVRFEDLQDYLTRNNSELKITQENLIRLACKIGY